jgi:hypothetical protein
MPKLVPPAMPPNRVAEARRIATAGRWFVNCPEMRCRGANACRGPLRGGRIASRVTAGRRPGAAISAPPGGCATARRRVSR